MIDTQKLRQKILDLAIRGKLVPQDPNDEPASVLLERIRAERDRLVAEGKIKRPKKSKVSSSESHYQNFEPPFEIPESWEWVTLDDLAFYKKGPFGSSLTKSMFVPKDNNTYKVYEQKNAIQKDATLGNYYISPEKFEELKGFEVFEKDIIVSCAGTIGETYVLPPNIESGIINQALMIVRLYFPEIKRYFLDYFDSVLKRNAAKDGKGTAMKNIPPFEVLKAYPFPLPPLKEQFRIAKALDSYFGLLGEVEQSKIELLECISFAKSKILELAMQGKLVPQNPTDEPAAEMLRRVNPKAKIITDNPHSWHMPNGWCLCELRDLCTFLSRGKSPKYSDVPNQYPVFAQKCNLKDGGISLNQARFLDESTLPKWPNKYKLKDQDILVNSTGTGTVGRTRLFLNKYLKEFPFVLPDSHVSVVRTFDEIDSKFIYFNLISREGQTYFNDNLSGSTNQKELYIEAIGNKLIFLPPKKETERIVTKIEELYHCIDKIEATLQS